MIISFKLQSKGIMLPDESKPFINNELRSIDFNKYK